MNTKGSFPGCNGRAVLLTSFSEIVGKVMFNRLMNHTNEYGI
jgi:hypothetical protein